MQTPVQIRNEVKRLRRRLARVEEAASAFLDERGDEHGTIQDPGPAEKRLRRMLNGQL